MEYKNKSLPKRIIATAIAIVLVITISSATAMAVARGEVKKVQAALTNTVKTDLGEYLAEYQGTASGSSGSLSADVLEEVGLSEEQITQIIEAVTSSIEYDLIKETISSYSQVSEDNLKTLEKKLTEKVYSVLDNSSHTASLSSNEKDSMIKTITAIVKSDMLSILSEHGGVDNSELTLIRTSLEKDVSDIEALIAAYELELDRIQDELTEMAKASNLEKTNVKLEDIVKEYNALVAKVNTLNKDLENASSSSLKEMQDLIDKNNQNNSDQIQATKDSIDELINNLTKEMLAVSKDLETSNATTQNELLNIANRVQNLTDVTGENKTQLESELEAAQDLLNQKIIELGQYSSSELAGYKTTIDQSLDSLRAGNTVDLNNLKDTLVAANSQLNIDLTASIDAKYAELNQNLNDSNANNLALITKAQQDMNAALAQMQTDVNNKINQTNQALEDKCDSLEDSQVALGEALDKALGYSQVAGSGKQYMVGTYENGTLTITSIGGQ